MNEKQIAEERIDLLFAEAQLRLKEPKLVKRYMELAKKVGMKYRVRLGKRKQWVCTCGLLLKPGVNCTVRLIKGSRVITCLDCGRTKTLRLRKG